MFDKVTVIGAGRAGSAIAARLRERSIAVGEDGDLRLLCVPDRAIAEVARRDRARARGSPTSRAGRRWPRSTRTCAGSRCIRCRR